MSRGSVGEPSGSGDERGSSGSTARTRARTWIGAERGSTARGSRPRATRCGRPADARRDRDPSGGRGPGRRRAAGVQPARGARGALVLVVGILVAWMGGPGDAGSILRRAAGAVKAGALLGCRGASVEPLGRPSDGCGGRGDSDTWSGRPRGTRAWPRGEMQDACRVSPPRRAPRRSARTLRAGPRRCRRGRSTRRSTARGPHPGAPERERPCGSAQARGRRLVRPRAATGRAPRPLRAGRRRPNPDPGPRFARRDPGGESAGRTVATGDHSK